MKGTVMFLDYEDVLRTAHELANALRDEESDD